MPLAFFIAAFWKLIWFLSEIEPLPPWHFLLGYSAISLATVLSGYVFVSLIFPRWKLFLALVFSLFTGIVVQSNLMYFRFFGIMLPLDLLFFADHTVDIRESILQLLSWKDAVLWCLDFSLLLFLAALKSNPRKPDSVGNLKPYLFAVFILLPLWTILLNPLKIPKWPFRKPLMDSSFILNPILNLAPSFWEMLRIKLRGQSPNQEIINETKALLEKRAGVSKLRIPADFFFNRKTSESPNIVFLQVESLMETAFFMNIRGKPVTPHLRRIAGNSLFLSRFYSQAFFTSDSDFAALTSLYPLQNQIVHGSFFRNTYQSLPKVLSGKGYHTIWAAPTRRNFWNAFTMNTQLGFNEIWGDENLGDGARVGPYLSDKAFLNKMTKVLKTAPKPFFAMLLTFSSHHPFKPKNLPPGIFSSLRAPKADSEMYDYIKCINYTDEAIGDFVKEMEDNNLLENTIIVIYGDHQVLIPTQKLELEKQFSKLPSHGIVMRFANSRIPCMFFAPKILKPNTINKICGQIDLAPTILSLLSFQKPLEFLGTSVFDDSPGFVVHKNFVGRTDEQLFWGRDDERNSFFYFAGLPDFLPEPPRPAIKKIFSDITLSEKMILRNACFFPKK